MTNSSNNFDTYLIGKSAHTLLLFNHFIHTYQKLGDVSVIPAKTMIGIATSRKRIAWVTQLGKNFLHIVFPFNQPYNDNLCFQRIALVPGEDQFNHHLRIFEPEDLNEEVISFMQLALQQGS